AGDAQNVLEQIARAGLPARSAAVRVDGTHAVVSPGRFGRSLDNAALLRLLADRRTVIDAPFARITPQVRTSAAREAAATIDTLLARPLAVDYHGARRGALTPVQLARAVEVRAAGHRVHVALNGDLLARIVRPRLAQWIVRAHNAQFAVAGDRVHVVPSRPGRDVDAPQLVSAVETAAGGDHVVRVELGPRQPDLTTADADALGIKQKLVSYTT